MDYNALRVRVLEAAYEGRATYLPAGARDNRTAEVFIDGERIGQASSLCHYVRPEAGRTFQEVKLVPGYDHQIPQHLRR
ncbi:MAG: hypothetical protein WAX14_03160 [Rhodococcus sp. (in: high G+C Gram-positive bacteria)]|uniref:hypothetical protein n=1 Tax=Rhodococcus sp. TaxID=1831 RepID=UPI003BB7FAE9